MSSEIPLASRVRDDFTDAQTEQLHEALMAHVAQWDYPVIARVEGGHTDPMPTFPLGVTVEVDPDLVIRETRSQQRGRTLSAWTLERPPELTIHSATIGVSRGDAWAGTDELSR